MIKDGEHAAQLSAASAVLQRSIERLADLSDVRVVASEVLTSIIGLLILIYHLSEKLPAERIRATRTLTRYAALVVELAWLADETRDAAVIRAQAMAAEERAAELASANAALSRSIEMLTSYEDLPRFTRGILHETIRASGADSGSVSLFDEATDTLRRFAVCLDGEAVDLAA